MAPITPSLGHAGKILPSRLRRIDAPYFDFLPSVVPRPPLLNGSPSLYPHLIRNLRNGFPLGEFPDIAEHVIFPMHRPSIPYQADIDLYLADEVVMGRMSGPFSREEATLILRGPFQCSSIVVDVQDGKLRICRHLSKSSKEHVSTNSFIDTEKFPTRFGSARHGRNRESLLPLTAQRGPTLLHTISHGASWHPFFHTCSSYPRSSYKAT
jgi:hypothetical protein